MILLGLFLAIPGVAHDVLVVDSTGGGDATTIQEAVDLVSDGGTVLVRRSTRPDVECCYPPFTVDGKSVAIYGLGGGRHYTGAATVRNLPEDGVVVLSDLDVFWPHGVEQDPFLGIGLRVLDCQGSVRIQNSRVSGFDIETYLGLPPTLAVQVSSSADVVMRNCELRGSAGEIGYGSAGSQALFVQNSAVALYGCQLTGGVGGSDVYLQSGLGNAGGDALWLSGGTLFARASSFTGGKGGPGVDVPSTGSGGTGIRASDGGAVDAVECTVAGGAGGCVFGSEDPAGVPGAPTIGDVDQLAGPTVAFDAPTSGEAGSSLAVRFEGPAGYHALLLASDRTTATDLGSPIGILHAEQPLFDGRMDLGPIPPSGVLEYDYPLPTVPAAMGTRLFLQAGFQAPDDTLSMAGVVTVEVLDGSFDEPCGARFYVDADAPAGGDGSSWATAFQSLELALLSAPVCPDDGVEIWVKQGAYTPPGDIFFVDSHIALYGGFEGDESSLAERDPAAHPTVLDGLGSNSSLMRVGTANDLAEGAVSGVRVDGFVFRGSRFFALNSNGELEVTRCRFEDNEGTAILSAGGGLRVSQSSFVGNGAHGVLAQANGVRPPWIDIAQCVFAGNADSGMFFGARVANLEIDVRNSTFLANGGLGGLVFEYDEGPNTLSVTNTILWANLGGPTVQSSQLALVPVGGAASMLGLTLEHDCVEGWDGSLGGVGNFGGDPRFLQVPGADGIAGTADDDLRLAPFSPCVDAGNNSAIALDGADLDHDGDRREPLPVDLSGFVRVQDVVWPGQPADAPPVVDVGAFETPRLRPRPAERR